MALSSTIASVYTGCIAMVRHTQVYDVCVGFYNGLRRILRRLRFFHINLKYRLKGKGIIAHDCCPDLPPEPGCPLPGFGNGVGRRLYISTVEPRGGGASPASSMSRAPWAPGRLWSTLPIYITCYDGRQALATIPFPPCRVSVWIAGSQSQSSFPSITSQPWPR